ncbi:hypothetical protein CSKR_110339 [Clonorchis sinensis]|uniref:Uncharacterized protein n=2 Tax=Clonorchis sinensis TaxID=79923 RepID=G7YAC6_CLOSI|nr:hypothetical protein CSKR_110339 [Clonorchis sinensis]GAA49910.1 hypothetical protein CLF_103770 [Clonorchis sinensis]
MGMWLCLYISMPSRQKLQAFKKRTFLQQYSRLVDEVKSCQAFVRQNVSNSSGAICLGEFFPYELSRRGNYKIGQSTFRA